MFDEPLISACNLAGNIVSGCQSVEDINGTLFTSQLAARAEMVGGGGGGGSTGEHNDLTGRDEENCHPQAAITGLVTALSGKVDKETDKGLSTNDYTTAEKNKLAGIEDGAQVNPDLSGYALTSDVNIALSGKVDKVAGKDLSTNDFTNDLKALLEQLGEESDPCKSYLYRDNFSGRISTTSNLSNPITSCMFVNTGGTFTTSAAVGEYGTRGIMLMSLGSGQTSFMYLLNNCTMLLGDGATVFITRFKTPTSLSTGTQRYIIMTGLMDDPSTSQNHCRFKYSNDVNAGNWQIETCNATTQTTTDSGVAVVANTWYKLAIIFNADATEAKYYINNVLVATITTNIPAANVVNYMTTFQKTIGTAVRTMSVDYHYLKQNFNTDVC